ncbi:hypothetical protein [Planomonospora algeriensis]
MPTSSGGRSGASALTRTACPPYGRAAKAAATRAAPDSPGAISTTGVPGQTISSIPGTLVTRTGVTKSSSAAIS